MPESSPMSEEVTRFTDDQSAALVSSYKENKHLIESASANDARNCVVADVNAAPGVAKSKSACKRRFKYLKKLYTSAAEINKTSGAARQTSPFYDLFHKMFGGRPSQTLQYVTESGTEKRKHVETPTPDSPPTTVSKNLEDQERHEPMEECQQPKPKKRVSAKIRNWMQVRNYLKCYKCKRKCCPLLFKPTVSQQNGLTGACKRKKQE